MYAARDRHSSQTNKEWAEFYWEIVRGDFTKSEVLRKPFENMHAGLTAAK